MSKKTFLKKKKLGHFKFNPVWRYLDRHSDTTYQERASDKYIGKPYNKEPGLYHGITTDFSIEAARDFPISEFKLYRNMRALHIASFFPRIN
jgi:hypothetical protein